MGNRFLPRLLAMALIFQATTEVGSADDGPLSLTAAAAVQMAMENNELIGMARTDARAARARVRESRADGLPAVSASAGYTRNWLLPTILFNDAAVKIGSDNELAGVVRLRQPLYTGGLVQGGLQLSRSQLAFAKESERQERQRIAAQAEVILYDGLLAAELARVQQLALQRARANLDQVQALRNAGRATRFEWTRAAVQVSSAESDSIESANDLALALIDLRDIIGVSLSKPIVVHAEFRETSILSISMGPEALLEQALQHRPECLQIRAAASANRADERVAKAALRPHLDLVAVGQMQFEEDSFSGVSDGGEWRRSWSTGVNLEIPLFDGMRSRSQVSRIREGRKRIQLEESRLDRTIEREVRQAWMDVAEAGQRLRARGGSVEQAHFGLEDAEARYRTGAGTQLEVLDAQLTLLQAESEHARARRDQAVALVELERAVGIIGEEVQE